MLGQLLIDRITGIEALATEQLRAGIPFHSVHTGTLALLRMLKTAATGELVETTDPKRAAPVQACTRAPERPRCEPREG